MYSRHLALALVVLSVLFVHMACCADTGKEEAVEVDEEKLSYAKGSACQYCDYCKFCKLCEEDCPCERSATKPNCHMCKYCKFCYLCSGVCDTICQPGGIIDKVSAAIVNALPSYNKEEVDEDLASVQGWINNNKKDEL